MSQLVKRNGTCRKALHSGVDRKARNCARSAASPVSKSVLAVISTSEIATSGAACPRIFLPARARASATAACAAPGAGIARTAKRASASVRSATHAASIASSSMASTSPASSALAADRLRPDGIIDSAISIPTRRGNRCVPPDPGTTPRMTSGRPSCADRSAIRSRCRNRCLAFR